MKSTLGLGAFAAALTIIPGAAHAVELDYVGVRAGTLGVGAEVGVSILPGLSVRGVYNTLDASFDETLDDVRYDGDLNLGSFGAIVDFKPLPVLPLYASAGIFKNDNQIDALGRPNAPVQIGNTTYTPAQIGTLRTSFEFEEIAPYAGLGLRFTLLKAQVNIDAGAYFQGAPKVGLSATGTLSGDAAFQQQLAIEKRNIENDLDGYEVYPVLNAGLRYKF